MRMQLIGNRYRIKGLIGEGGMASVYSAIDEKLDRRIAIKILHSHLARNQDIRKRFHQEAKSISGIDHPNIIKIYDFSGVDSDQLWIVTEILYGVDLAEYVQRFPRNRIHPLVATLITREICKSLSEAHRHGIVHRDVKPENIMVLDSGRIKLMDFGIAKVAQNPSATQTGTFMGSPSYMSPEQIRGTKIDGRSDIYSLSVLFYEIITGTLPFVGNTTPDVINKIIVGKFSPPIAIYPALPDNLNKLIVRGLQSNKDHRFPEINQLAAELDRFLAQCGMAESHVELERFFRNPKEFEKKLAEFNKNNQLKPKMLKITDSGDNDNTPRPRATTRMTAQGEQVQNQNSPTMPPANSMPSRGSLGPTPVSTHSGSNGLRPSHPQQQRHVSGRARKVTQVPQRQRIPQRPQMTVRVTRAKQSSNFFWTAIIVISLAMVTLIAGKIFLGGNRDANNISQVRKELLRQKQDWQRSRIATNQTAASNQSNPSSRRHEIEENKAANQVSSSSTSATTTTIEDQQNRIRSNQTPTRVENPPPATRVERPSTASSNIRRPISQNPPRQLPPRRTSTVIRSQPEGAQPENIAKEEKLAIAPPKVVNERPQEEAKPGVLYIRSFPAAEIYIDDQARGTTNDRRTQLRGISLPAGKYRLSLRRNGYESAEEVLEIKDDDNLKLNYVLSKKQVYVPVTVQSNRIPALIYIEELKDDGRKNQLTLTENTYEMQMEPGTYRIEVVYSGQRVERVLDIRESSDAFTYNANFD
ncbi:MAG: serine/threonine-protein kinase [Oligoflexus sp.]